MSQSEISLFSSPVVRKGVIFAGIFALLSCFLLCIWFNLGYIETKGPFKNWAQVADWEADGDLDVIISHTRWEKIDLSWAGIGIWVNQGNRLFELVRNQETERNPFTGFTAGAEDVDQDGDIDIFTQDFAIRLWINQSGLQAGQAGTFLSSCGINSPPGYDKGYRDMGGTISTGDLNGDGWMDVFVAGCCYGIDPWKAGDGSFNAPSLSWVWINDYKLNHFYTGHVIPLDFLDGRPIRQAALGDLDEDGDLDVFAAVGKPTMGTIPSWNDLILLNDGKGGLTASDQTLGNMDSTSVALGDVNGDCRLDALVGTNTGASLWINQSKSTENSEPIFFPSEQSFEAIQTVKTKLQAEFSTAAEKLLGIYLPYGSIRTQAVFLVDLDEDGDLDALLARVWGAEIWWNNGQGVFSRSDVRFKYREDTGVTVADFDGDGDQDIFTGRNEGDYQVWWNDGRGIFADNNP